MTKTWDHAGGMQTLESCELHHVDHHSLVGFPIRDEGDHAVIAGVGVLADTSAAIDRNTHVDHYDDGV